MMTRISLLVYANPGHAEVYLRFSEKSGETLRLSAVVDTGSHATLLPERYAKMLDLKNPRQVWLGRAGVTGLDIQAIEAEVLVQAESIAGEQTEVFKITVWFAGTLEVLAGYGGFLNRCALYLDTPNLNGYLEFPD